MGRMGRARQAWRVKIFCPDFANFYCYRLRQVFPGVDARIAIQKVAQTLTLKITATGRYNISPENLAFLSFWEA